MTYEEAKEALLQETICWQHNAAKHYRLAMEERTIFINSFGSGSYKPYRYEHEMSYAQSFQMVAMRNLILLIGK